MQKNKQNLRDLQNMIKNNKICLMEVPEEKVKKKEAQNLSKQEENINLHICEAQQIPIRINFKTSISRHIIDRMLTANEIRLDLQTQCLKNYRWRFATLCRTQWSKLSQGKTNARRQSGCLSRLYKQLQRKEKQKAREKGEDTPN